MYKILTLNNISSVGLNRLPRENYEIASEFSSPDAILVRSAKMHDMELPASVKAIGRAGAGTNNIPVQKMSERGICVFNAPGANANAVKELVLAGMLLAARNIPQAWDFARNLEGTDAEIGKAVEAGKKNYVGGELPGRTLGVIGLGAIGVLVANAARSLGMKVIGYDPTITVERAWQISSEVEQAASVDDLLRQVDFVTFHVPLTDATRGIINAERLKIMKDGVVILNFARDGVVDDAAVCAVLDTPKIGAYVCDFPTNCLKNNPKAITLPHLGASTREAEENCAVMVADQIREYLEDGNIANSVNFPSVNMPRASAHRLSVVNANVPDMVGQISRHLAEGGLNIQHMVNESRGDLAYTLMDVSAPIPDATRDAIAAVKGVLSVRVL
ncbi:MAG: 3-phosphoglycerate dehydrogenase [Gammaproteobacteria bacterium]|nr:3-phosphoglycerate dehydrogenase [Gammaproteobacteria bacterium]